MNSFASSKRLKYSAKRHLTGHYAVTVGATVTVQLISSAVSLLVSSICDRSSVVGAVIFYIAQLLVLLLMALFTSGQCYLFLNMCCGRPVTSGMIFYSCRNQPEKAILIQVYQLITYFIIAAPAIVCMILWAVIQQTIFLTVSVILLVLSALLITYCGIGFSQSFYLLHDFPNNSAQDLLSMSCRMMRGHKIRYLALLLSFIPLYLAALLSFGIGLLWVNPYVNTAATEFFLDLMNHKE